MRPPKSVVSAIKSVIEDEVEAHHAAQEAAGVTGEQAVTAEYLEALQRVAVSGVLPDCTIILDLAADKGLARARSRGGEAAPDRFEREEVQTHEKRREAYLEIAAADPERCHVVDADRVAEDIARDILSIVQPLASGDASNASTNVETVG